MNTSEILDLAERLGYINLNLESAGYFAVDPKTGNLYCFDIYEEDFLIVKHIKVIDTEKE